MPDNYKRYQFLDYLKGFGILMVFFTHCSQYFRPMHEIVRYVYSFNVPIFFVASGCLAYYQREKNISFPVFVQKRVKSLLVPWLIFSIINSAIRLIVLLLRHGLTRAIVFDEMTQFFIIGNGTVWFLTTLFCVEVIFAFLKDKISNFLNWKFLVAILCVCIFLPYMIQILQVNSLGKVLIRTIASLGYYIAGYILTAFLVRLAHCKKNLIIGISLLLIGLAFYIFFGCNIGFMNGFFVNPLGTILCSYSNCCGLVFLFASREFGQPSFIEHILLYYGKNSLIAMLVHPTLLLCFTYPLGNYFMTSCIGIKGVLFALALYFSTILLVIPFVWLIKNKVPWLIGKKRRV